MHKHSANYRRYILALRVLVQVAGMGPVNLLPLDPKTTIK